mmetsp:Transcript_12043/g.33339  ORF Transcript_12043/g.33339 Transcript_12043/m.33339 type:complete len:131 (-) Transcript_12043:752-1144(-)
MRLGAAMALRARTAAGGLISCDVLSHKRGDDPGAIFRRYGVKRERRGEPLALKFAAPPRVWRLLRQAVLRHAFAARRVRRKAHHAAVPAAAVAPGDRTDPPADVPPGDELQKILGPAAEAFHQAWSWAAS